MYVKTQHTRPIVMISLDIVELFKINIYVHALTTNGDMCYLTSVNSTGILTGYIYPLTSK